MTAKPYKPITTLSDEEVSHNRSLSKRQLRHWESEKKTLFTGEAKENFYKRWGIELGLVENIFRWDRGVTMTLIEQGISTDLLVKSIGTSEEDANFSVASITSHVETLKEFEMGFVNGEIQLTANFIRQLHEKLLHNQRTYMVYVPGQGYSDRELNKGGFKESSNDPFDKDSPDTKIKSYCPPLDTEAEVINLCDLYKTDMIQSASAEVRAAWLHHRFTQIHPFADGNGRVARTLASLVLLKEGLPPLIVRRDEDRSVYLDSLEDADNGSLQPLVDIFIDRIRNEIMQIIVNVTSGPETLDVARKSLLERFELRMDRSSIFTHLHAHAVNRWGTVSQDIRKILTAASRSSERFEIGKTVIVNPGEDSSHSYDDDIRTLRFSYKPRLEDICGYVCFPIFTDYHFNFILHFHERDPLDGGGFAIVPIIIEEEHDEEGSRNVSQVPIEPFIISLEDSEQSVSKKLLNWTHKAIDNAISIWARSV